VFHARIEDTTANQRLDHSEPSDISRLCGCDGRQYELQKPVPDGCNWSEDIVLNYGTSQSEAVLQHLRPLHREARRRFNVGEP